MRTKHLFVLIHIKNKGEVGTIKVKIFLADRSKTVLLLWIFFAIYVHCLTCFLIWCPGSGVVLDCIDV